jgi:hypothetical protein
LTLARILAVLSAVFMVAAFACATLLPPLLPLAQLISMADSNVLFATHEYVVSHLSGWAWSNLLLPVLLRPAWLVPVSLGVLLAGGATTLASRDSIPRSRRRRS